VYFGSSDGNVYALEAATGAMKWKFKTGDVVLSSPALADGTLFIGTWDTYLYALDATSGTEKWRFKTGEDHEIYNQVGIQGSPAVADGIIYFGCRIPTSMRSLRLPENSVGSPTTRVHGSSIRQPFATAKYSSRRRTRDWFTHWTQSRRGYFHG
jgi:hypothetical protein